MLRSQKLDSILTGLIYLDTLILKDENLKQKITLNWLDKALNLDCEKWEMKSLEDELLFKNYITKINGEILITNEGKEFKMKKGYEYLDGKKNQEDLIRKKTIDNFKYSKLLFFISLLPVFISIFELQNIFKFVSFAYSVLIIFLKDTLTFFHYI